MSHTDLTPCTRVLASSGTVPIAEELLARVLEPYSCKGCRYLIDAQYSATEDSVLAYGNFTIGESAYIRSTGHFNAVELILCFNQLAYSAFAPAVLNEEIRVLRGWSIDDYCQHQLSSMLIRKASSRFRKPLNPQKVLCPPPVSRSAGHRTNLALSQGPVRHRVLGRERRGGVR